MAHQESRTTSDVMERLMDRDPDLRREWWRTALARAVTIEIIRHRADNGLSQAEPAQHFKMHQPTIPKLEEGKQNPSIAILRRLSEKLEVNLAINIHSAVVGVEPLIKASA